MAPRAETGFVRLHPPPPSPPKPATDSSLAEKPFLRPFLASDGLRFPASARRHRLQAPFWRASLRRRKSRSKLEESGGTYLVVVKSRPKTEWLGLVLSKLVGHADRKSARGEFGVSEQLREALVI